MASGEWRVAKKDIDRKKGEGEKRLHIAYSLR